MNNSLGQNGEYEELTYKLNAPEVKNKTRSPKINLKKPSPIKQYKESSFVPKKFSLVLDENRKSKEDRISKSDNNRKNSDPNAPRKGEVKKFELRKDSVKRAKKKDGVNRKFIRKNAKKINLRNAINKIKVVGTVSAKLNALIQRLEQNNATSGNANSNQYGDKVVMAPRIKEALEKFNKKKEDKPEIMHFGDQKRRRKKNSNIEEKFNKEEISNGYNNYEEENNEEEEYEYEEDEDYEEEDEEEEEEEKKNEQNNINDKKFIRSNLKRSSKKKRTREAKNDVKIIKDNINEKKKKKKRKENRK